MRRQTVGFGFFPEERELHFQVTTDGRGQPVMVTEHMGADEPGTVRITIPWFVWDRIAQPITATLNERLTRHGDRPGRFRIRGATPLEWHAGKELMVLAWALEHVTSSAQIADVERALANWQGMAPEVRWFYYTETNAASGGPAWRGRGWRAALYHILVQNPIGRPDLDLLAPTPLPTLLPDDMDLNPLPWRKAAASDPAARITHGATNVVVLAAGPTQVWLSATVARRPDDGQAFVTVQVSIWVDDQQLACAIDTPGWMPVEDCVGEMALTALARAPLSQALDLASAQVRRIVGAARDFARLNSQLLGVLAEG
jgi:hypothetical protein